MITIKDMASMLGLSTTTVSNVIHGKTSEVSKTTVEKVQQMLKEYDYIPNINARNLAQNSSNIIGLALRTSLDKYDNLMADPFMGELVGSIEKEVRKMGYFFMLYISDDINEIIQYVSTWNVDGLILAGLINDEYSRLRKRYKKPVLIIDSYGDKESLDCVNIGLEDNLGSYQITRYLILNGHQKIGFVTDNLKGVDYERYKGHCQAMQDYGLPFRKKDLILLKPHKGQVDESLKELYEVCSSYTAFVCASDYYAATIINYLKDHGIDIPNQISVTGFDDNILSRICRPAITTVHQNVTKKGEEAVHTLFRMINGENVNRDICLPVKLIIRDSVKDITTENE